MNKVLLRVGGGLNLLFVLVHLGMVKSLRDALAPVSLNIQATASTWNIQVAFVLVIFAYLAFFQWRALLATRLGNLIAVSISLFWFLRAVNQVVFYGPSADAMPLVGICLLVGLLHLVPALREWRKSQDTAEYSPALNQLVLGIGGAINLLFVLLNLSMVKSIDGALASLAPDTRAAVSPVVAMLDIHVAFTLLIFACLSFFQWRAIAATRLGNITAIAVSMFWFLRAISQPVFYRPTASGVPMIVLCVVSGLLYLVPALREWSRAPDSAQHPAQRCMDSLSTSQGHMGRAPWTSYAIVAWCVVFGGLHLYWALGGNAGFVEFSTPSSRPLALARDPVYMVITWGVVLACVVATVVALAPFQAWTRRLPRWILLTPLWIGCGLFLVRGVGNLIQSALLVGGGMPFDPLPAAEVQAWNEWMLLDAILYCPWFILGGLAFGATARVAGRQVAGRYAGAMVGQA